ncbi:FKBP-type peptidyl-prolyl cis-trans isomerase [Pseudoduganella ginsengisoli]|nr:FKBP-type peptidyl-prolyl cis-trans isomerase [Pseudoduganella ginsengisoli]
MKSMFLKFVPLFCALTLTACGGGAKKTTTVEIPAQPAPPYKTNLIEGKGDTVVAGDLATVNYTGYLYDSTKPNSRGTEFEKGTRSFAPGTGAVLPGTNYSLLGWDQEVPGMRVGGKANLVLPYNLAYGVHEYTSPTGIKVPVYTPVVFEVEVVSVKKASPSAAVTIADITVGTGAAVEYSKTYAAKYTGWLYDSSKAGCSATQLDAAKDCKGAQFDTNTSGTFTFSLNGGLIKGWDRGVLGMKVGGKRTVVIPPELGYGSTPQTKTENGVTTTTIPANSTLVFEIELVSVK